jgi:predicted metal-dependent hydrolase
MPSPLWLVSQQLGYLMPWYDPLHEAQTEDALAYLDHSPAAKRTTLKVA